MAKVAEVANEVLRLSGIRKSFGIGTPTEIEILHGIDLVLQKGEFVALIGPSGSGKSTLLNLIGLLDRPTSGQLRIEGTDTTTLDEAQLTHLRGHRIGFVFQSHYLISAFTALENVMMPMLLDRGRPDAAMRAVARDLLTRVGLAERADYPASNMSGGQQQRVAIARALAMSPPLILADEPTGNLDTKATEGVFALMRDIASASGTTFLLVTHNLALAHQCDRIIELVDGQVVTSV
ncbi:ABC transporter ATP-binding protein [Actimicrobium sp. CCI2.3]|uniref:ABC transporter ATP-binding protein n=1 Tax=Actimicrobium sp. CCI2.3 TaxID=3048616 RepID=UPI002AB37427|nr:ABC transporter ATP-binding protein [Actimicrobium sp. CCI2.3]MDY7575472.1 ABC transporter ATP-binding protein [Actimicrobium sp. CCI2.3]MEB0024039.1 ABC transporter ATP-binding protein [Actimicrobium sp. CCI2.3]